MGENGRKWEVYKKRIPILLNLLVLGAFDVRTCLIFHPSGFRKALLRPGSGWRRMKGFDGF
jgi:hypothetical protein